MKMALLTRLNAPLEIYEMIPGDLQFGQVLVKILVSGICGAQLQEISGQKAGGPLPHPLGHEGCGIVEAIGPEVKHVKIGDKVVMHWRKGAGIESDFPRYQVKALRLGELAAGSGSAAQAALECGAPAPLSDAATRIEITRSNWTPHGLVISGTTCPKCDGYVPGHAGGAGDICTCEPITTQQSGADAPHSKALRAEGHWITGGRVTTFGTHSICSENRLTAVPMDTPDELCALLGCGLSTALATLENEACLRRGESILVVGCGGLGTNLILASKMQAAGRIVATDIHADKGFMAAKLGATFWPFDATQFIAGPPEKFDVIVETSGRPSAIHATVPMLAPGGRFVMVGQPKPGERVSLENAFHFFEGEGKSFRATQGGGYRPDKDIPRYLRSLSPSIPEMLVSHRFPLDQINEGIEAVKRGEASRVMIHMKEPKNKL